MRAKCATYLILLDVAVLIIFDEEHKLSSFCNFLQPPAVNEHQNECSPVNNAFGGYVFPNWRTPLQSSSSFPALRTPFWDEILLSVPQTPVLVDS
jgi:hypothetical protein